MGSGNGELQRSASSSVKFAPASSWAPQPAEWFWTGRIPFGTLTVFAGVPGLGKSTVLTDLVARGSRGQLEGAFHGMPVTSIFSTMEDSLTVTTIPRLHAAGADLARVYLPEDGEIILPERFSALAHVQQQTAARIVIFDPLVAHLSNRVNSWRDQDIRRALAPLVRWAEISRTAVIAVVHLNKGDSSDVFTRIGGSIGISAAARSLLVAAPDPHAAEAGAIVLANPKNNLAPRAPILRYRLEERTITHAGEVIRISGVAWLGEANDVLVEDLLRPQTDDDRSERQEAATWLRELLTDRPRPPKEVFTEGKRYGFTERTIWRAKKTLGVLSSKSPEEKVRQWVLP